MSKKAYIGDGVYVELDDRMGGVVLTTEDGISISNQIFMEPLVLRHFMDYIKREFGMDVRPSAQANAERILACVHAMAGLAHPENLPTLIAGLEAHIENMDHGRYCWANEDPPAECNCARGLLERDLKAVKGD